MAIILRRCKLSDILLKTHIGGPFEFLGRFNFFYFVSRSRAAEIQERGGHFELPGRGRFALNYPPRHSPDLPLLNSVGERHPDTLCFEKIVFSVSTQSINSCSTAAID
jgi:hypothetical protein